MGVNPENATVYRAELKGKRYLTKQGAIYGEASALIESRHPTEGVSRDDQGIIVYGGFHWREMPRSDVLHRRVCRLVKRLMEQD